MKKRILALSLSAVLLLALLCACGDPGSENSDPSGANTSGVTTQEPSNPPTEQPPAQVDLAAFYLGLTEKYAVCETPEQAYPDDAVNEDFTAEDLAAARESLRQLGLDSYPGLADIAAEQCLVYVSMMSFNGAESVLVQVKNASDVDAVKTILQTRIDAQKSGGAWYPAAVEGWEKNSRIVSNGNYVMLIVSEDCDAIVNDFNALFA